jgi:FSR family fosmidomycin resistance protein-like MFS transporter
MAVNKIPQKSIFFLSLIKGAFSLTFLFLLIEFFDEFNYGVGNAALPAIRTDLGLTYVQVGLLLGLPGIINTFIEPGLMLLGDTRFRKHIMLGGGLAIMISLLSIAATYSFSLVLFGMMIAYPASGAFVSLSQATLMDLNPGREPQMMARWTVTGSIANLVGPLLLAGGFALGFGWRWAFFAMAAICLLLVLITWRRQIPIHPRLEQTSPPTHSFTHLLSGLWQAATFI